MLAEFNNENHINSLNLERISFYGLNMSYSFLGRNPSNLTTLFSVLDGFFYKTHQFKFHSIILRNIGQNFFSSFQEKEALIPYVIKIFYRVITKSYDILQKNNSEKKETAFIKILCQELKFYKDSLFSELPNSFFESFNYNEGEYNGCEIQSYFKNNKNFVLIKEKENLSLVIEKIKKKFQEGDFNSFVNCFCLTKEVEFGKEIQKVLENRLEDKSNYSNNLFLVYCPNISENISNLIELFRFLDKKHDEQALTDMFCKIQTNFSLIQLKKV